MKKLVVNMGLAATGVAACQMACAQALQPGPAKDWNVSTSLQGFYDDNYTTAPSRKGSFGFEVSPTISANVPLTQTDFGLLYTYGLQYYEERDHLNQNPIDQSHTLNFWLDHAFNERWHAKVSDSFNVGQEPALLAPGQPVSAAPFRLDGNNIANDASAMLHSDWSRQFSSEITYDNFFSDYSSQPYAGELNRDQNTIALDLQWHFSPETTALIGYEFGTVNYTDGAIIATYGNNLPYYSDARDNVSHYVYVGLNHNLLPNLVAAGKVGLQYTDNYNDPLQKSTDLSPYVLLSLIYTYLPGCNAQVGFTQSRNATDLTSVGSNGSLTLNQESSTVYASVNHQVTSKLLVSVVGNFSDSTFNGGLYNGQSDTDYNLGVNANYSFTRHISGQAGYNYDNLTSPDSARVYERNRYYIGLTISY